MGKLNDLTGQTFGRLTVLQRSGSNAFNKATWDCECSCGKRCVIIGSGLRAGKAVTCGCYRLSGDCKVSHGATRSGVKTRGYQVWLNMRRRCDSATNKQRKDYGGRGITYCREWNTFEGFIADMGEPPEGLTLDRINNDGGYSKDNCRWTDRVVQRRNSRSHVNIIEIDGEKMLLTDAVRKYRAVSYHAAASRISRGWNPVDAVLTPYTRTDNKGYRE